MKVVVNCVINGGLLKQGIESETEDNEEIIFDKFFKFKDNVNSFVEVINNFKGIIVGVDNFKEIFNVLEEVYEIEVSNRYFVDLEKDLDFVVKGVENDMNFFGCCSVNVISILNKKSFNFVQLVYVNNFDSFDDKIDDFVWICFIEKVEELSSIEKGEGLGLLMKNYD